MKKTWLLLMFFVVLPMAVQAEIYKWKDSSGVIRYSDVPPPSNVPHETLNARKAVPAAPEAAAEKQTPPPANPEADAVQRQQKAEQEKIQNDANAAEQESRRQNCARARTELQKFKVGGRILKMNEQGEREYLSNADIAQGLEQAQRDVAQFCDE